MTTNTQIKNTARPFTITVIGWLFLITGILSVIIGPLLFVYHPVIQEAWNSLGINLVMAAVGLFVSGFFYIITGFAILQGKSWGRTLYFIFGFILVVLSFDFYNQILFAILSGLLPYTILVWQFTRKSSNAWFT